jgi:hypothetical protein
VFGWQASTERVEPATPAAPIVLRNLPREILFIVNLPILDSFARPTTP